MLPDFLSLIVCQCPSEQIQTEGTARRDSGYADSFTQPRPAQLPQPPSQPQPQPQPPAQSISQSPPSDSMHGTRRISPRSDNSNGSSAENIKKIRQFLDEKEGQSLNAVEVAGLVHLLQNSVEGQHPIRSLRMFDLRSK